MTPNQTVAVDRDVMVPMRDGVRLAADIYRPAEMSPMPVLLCRTPYDKSEAGNRTAMAMAFAEHGYVAAIQDTRGRHGSEGEFGFLHPEAEDGQDTVAWLRRQPWCDGRVGTWGGSYEGWAQTAIAALGTEGLAAMVPYMCGANGFTSSIRHNGALELRWPAWAFVQSGAPAEQPFSHWLARWPVQQGQTQLAATPAYERMALDLVRHDTYGDFWAHPSVNPAAHLDRFPDAPALLIGGWYDSYARGTIELYTGLARRDPRTRLIMGPWAHCQSDQPAAGDAWFGEHAVLDLTATHLTWFDRCLRHRGYGFAPVRVFVMGGGSGEHGPLGHVVHGGRWRDEAEWPLARTAFTAYYLHGDGTLSPEPPDAAHGSSMFRFDPDDPVPTRGGNVSALAERLEVVDDPGERTRDLVSAGGFDQGPAGMRSDVLTFHTPPLDHGVEVTGPIEVRLWADSTTAGVDLTAKLMDVYPDGYALNLTDSIVRAELHGAAREVTITLYPTSNLFAPGHRIRLDISGSNFPRFDLNPHGAAINRIFHNADQPSRLVLPLIPSAA